jgi:hypothetical protein
MAAKKGNAAAGTDAVSERAEPKFSREQAVASARYANRRDLVSSLLKDGETYTIAEIDKKIDEYKKGKVK